MKFVETGLWLSGALLIALYFFGRYWGESASQQGIASFVEQKQRATPTAPAAAPPIIATEALSPATALPAALPPVTPAAVAKIAVVLPNGATIAVLRIPRIAMEVPVSDGTTERVLLAGAGLVEGTASPGSVGNIGIAAHRDTFFRGLKDVVVGDLIELETLAGTDTYRVSTLSVVAPSDVYVLAATAEPALTLVTCYPFYFVGNAPQRFIVRAVAAEFHSQPPRKKT
jgi:sortase A